ncbi:MAG: hypothetical protein R3236_11565, partial [Phycisphaeraceae bacterium]|nr:hypothetical protein [Phycisphaeraceae bacterium]
PLVDADVRTSIKLFGLGGESIMKKIAAIDYDTLQRRPSLGKMGKTVLMLRALAAKVMGGGR